jgi:DNA-nicking Smr family endonuclease
MTGARPHEDPGQDPARGRHPDREFHAASGRHPDRESHAALGRHPDREFHAASGRHPDREIECGAVPIPMEDALDLHAIGPRDVPVVVEEYLWEASAAGFAEVRIIHGKGIGVQRRRVASVLEKHPVVISYRLASSDRGHYGATIARLRTDLPRPAESSPDP